MSFLSNRINFLSNRKGLVKVGKCGLIIFSILFFGFFILNSATEVKANPGSISGTVYDNLGLLVNYPVGNAVVNIYPFIVGDSSNPAAVTTSGALTQTIKAVSFDLVHVHVQPLLSTAPNAQAPDSSSTDEQPLGTVAPTAKNSNAVLTNVAPLGSVTISAQNPDGTEVNSQPDSTVAIVAQDSDTDTKAKVGAGGGFIDPATTASAQNDGTIVRCGGVVGDAACTIAATTAVAAKNADHFLKTEAADDDEQTNTQPACAGSRYYDQITVDLDGDGVADDKVQIVLCDADNTGTVNASDTFAIDADASGSYDANNVHSIDERTLAADPDQNLKFGTSTSYANSFTVHFAGTIGNADDVSATQKSYYESTFSVDTDQNGAVNTIDFILIDTDSDNIFTRADIDVNDNAAYAGAGELNKATAATLAIGVNANDFTFTITDTTPGTGAVNMASITQTHYYQGTFTIDTDGDGTADDTVTYVLIDDDSDNLFTKADIDLNANSAYGTGETGKEDDDTVAVASGIDFTFNILDTTPAVGVADDVSMTSTSWFTGTWDIDIDADESTETVYWALSDADSDGVYDNLDISLDATYGEGAANSIVTTDDDETIVGSTDIQYGDTVDFLFTTAFDGNPTADSNDARVTSKTWYTGTYTIDTDADGAADDPVNYALSDSDSDGVFETMDISTDDATYGETALETLTDGVTGTNNDERITATTDITLGSYEFTTTFNDIPGASDPDSTITSTEWFTGTFTIDASGAGTAGDTVYFALSDSDSDGVFETMDISLSDATFGEVGDGTLVDGIVIVGNDEQITISGDIDYGTVPLLFTTDFDGNPPNDANDASMTSKTWYTKDNGVTLEGTAYDVIVIDSDSDGVFDKVSIDKNDDGHFNDAGFKDLAVDDTFQGALKLQYTILSISGIGEGFTLKPTDATEGSTTDWYVGTIIPATGTANIAVSDNDNDGNYETVDFDEDNNGVLETSGLNEGFIPVTIGAADYQVMTIDDLAAVVKITEYIDATVGEANDLSASGTQYYGTFLGTDVLVVDADNDATYDTIFIDTNNDGSLADKTPLAVDAPFSIGVLDYKVTSIAALGTAFTLQQTNSPTATATTAQDGTYSISADDGTYWVEVVASGYDNKEDTNANAGHVLGDLAAVDEGLTLAAGGSEIQGTVTREATADGLNGVLVEIIDHDSQTVIATTETVTDVTDGKFSIGAVDIAASYDIRFSSPGYVTATPYTEQVLGPGDLTSMDHVLQYTIRVLSVTDELGNAVEIAGTPFSATGFVIVDQEVVGGVGYVAATSVEGTLIFTKDGFVDISTPVIPTDVSQTDVTYTGMQYAVQITVTREGDSNPLTGANVDTGDAFGTDCVEQDASGVYYCAVLVGDVGTDVRIVKDGYVSEDVTGWADRGASDDPQSTVTITDVLFGLKVIYADELGNPIIDVNTETFRDVGPTLSLGDTRYWEDTAGAGGVLVIEKAGYVNSEVTNTFDAITTTNVGQTVITLGDNAVCGAVNSGANTDCKGLMFTLKVTVQDAFNTAIEGATVMASKYTDHTIYAPAPDVTDSNDYYFALDPATYDAVNVLVVMEAFSPQTAIDYGISDTSQRALTFNLIGATPNAPEMYSQPLVNGNVGYPYVSSSPTISNVLARSPSSAVTSAEYRIDSIEAEANACVATDSNFDGTYEITCDLTDQWGDLPEGRHNIFINASNAYGSSGLAVATFNKDTLPPLVEVLDPWNGVNVGSTNPTISFDILDNAEIDSSTIAIWLAEGENPPVQLAFTFNGFVDPATGNGCMATSSSEAGITSVSINGGPSEPYPVGHVLMCDYNIPEEETLVDGATYTMIIFVSDKSGNLGMRLLDELPLETEPLVITTFTVNTTQTINASLIDSRTNGIADGTYENGWVFKFNISTGTGGNGVRFRMFDWETSSAPPMPVFNNTKMVYYDSDGNQQIYWVRNYYDDDEVDGQQIFPLQDVDPDVSGIQGNVTIYVKIPVGTVSGSYSTSYGAGLYNIEPG